MPRTGVYLSSSDMRSSVLDGEVDPVTLDPLEEVAHPVMVGDDHRHFYDLATILRCLERKLPNPINREPFTIHEVHALLVTPGEAYVDTLRILAIHGKRGLVDELTADLEEAALSSGFREYAVEEVRKAFQFAEEDDPASEANTRTVQKLRRSASLHAAPRAVREAGAVAAYGANPPMWLWNAFCLCPMRYFPCSKGEASVVDRFVTVRWYACAGRPNQTFLCARMAEELEQVMRALLGPGGWTGDRPTMPRMERMLQLLKQRLPIHPSLSPPCFVLHPTTEVDQLRAIFRVLPLGTVVTTSLGQWIDTHVYPVLRQRQEELAWIDYGTLAYRLAIEGTKDLGACFARGRRSGAVRFVAAGVRKLPLLPPAFVRYDDAAMDEDELRQITYTPSVGDAPFYYNLRALRLAPLF